MMKNLFIAVALSILTIGGTVVATRAATFDFTFENGMVNRVIRAGILGNGDVMGFSPMGRGTQTFQVVLPNGECLATLRITFSNQNGLYRRSFYDVANHNFCTGPNGVRLVRAN